MATDNTQGENLHVSHDTEQQVTPHHEERPGCSTGTNTIQEPVTEQDDFQHGTDGAGVVKTEYVDVTEESEANQIICCDEGNNLLKSYEDNEIKSESVIGPTVAQGVTIFGTTEHSKPGSERVLNNEDKEHNVLKPEHQKRRISCDKVHSCEVCSKTFETYNTLKYHMTVHTEQEIFLSNKKRYTCDVCSKCFKQKSKLQRHLLIHTSDKPHSCDICSKCFKEKSKLKRHLSIHTGEKPYSCDVCSKCFNQNSILQRHLMIHTGEKPYSCDVCSKCFKEKSKLKRHLSIHTGEKPYSCNECSQCFNQNSTLQRHLMIHIGDKPHNCNICNKCFNRKSSLQRHLSIHTSEKYTYSCK
ncbi:zinc finger protein 3 homolog [Galleria mellonella]|uniref:Zinc finger protein 3 homolog n=1 Tax=Galleria mellonella TaxID=7137 RepID=A0ABM3MRJ1_GALME|nr:zinc finger protein 3 homolog [Galleria mellonella]